MNRKVSKWVALVLAALITLGSVYGVLASFIR